MYDKDIQFDVAVIGGGPSGMMAAICAAKKGARVALIEKNDRLGIKLLMAGNGRCNFTQNEKDLNELVKKYGKNGRFLYSSLAAFGPEKIITFLEKAGIRTKVEKDNRVFPVSDQGKDVLGVLENMLKENNVTFLLKSTVEEIEFESGEIKKIILNKKREIAAHNYIFAVGGKSYPSTGSAGQGYEWAKKIGHSIIEPQPLLVPIETREKWVEELAGIGVHSCAMSVWQNGKKQVAAEGDMLFTHLGVSGPLVLNLSRSIRPILENGEVKIKIDFKPYLTFEKLDEILRKDFEKNASKKLANCLADLLSPKLLAFLLKHSGLDLEKHAAKISKQERHALINLFKGLELTVEKLFGFERAMVTGGGVSTKEIDSKTMRSKIIKNLFFAGEIIDVDGPTGGYNLQMCWATGFIAGVESAKK